MTNRTRTRSRAACTDENGQMLSARRQQRDEMNSGSAVFVIGLDYDVKTAIHWTEAVTGLIVPREASSSSVKHGSDRPIYTAFKVHETKRVRSAGGTIDIAWPIIVRLNIWHDVPFKKPIDLDAMATKGEIMQRDGWTCAYCAGYATTIDHVHPQARGGLDTFGNLVAACTDCNGEKSDLSIDEFTKLTGKRLLWNPRAQDLKYAGVQAEVWRILQNQDE